MGRFSKYKQHTLKNVRDPFYGVGCYRDSLERHMSNGNRICVWKFKRCRVWHLAWSNDDKTVCGLPVIKDCASYQSADWPEFRLAEHPLCPRCRRIHDECYQYVIRMYKDILHKQWFGEKRNASGQD